MARWLKNGTRQDWTASITGAPHAWRVRNARQVRLAAMDRPSKDADSGEPMTLRSLGIEGTLEDHTPDHEARSTVDRFVDVHHLDHAGVDRVLTALDRRRYAREDD